MPTPETALVYPGMCLVEGSELSEGRGTTKPFEWSGAAHLAAAPLAAAMNAMALPGCVLRAATFLPTFHKHHGLACGGVQIHVTDAHAFRPYLTAVAFLKLRARSSAGAVCLAAQSLRVRRSDSSHRLIVWQ